MQNISNPILQILDETFSKSTIRDIELNYLKTLLHIDKWVCYSDYCFNDENKPNDVVTFSLFPYIDDFEELQRYINSKALVDIKKTSYVNEDYINFLRTYPVINFSFILNDKKDIFGNNSIDIRKSLTNTFSMLKQQYVKWTENQPEQAKHYAAIIKKIDCTIRHLNENKKIKNIIEMLLVTFLGAYVSSVIVKKTGVTTFAWFSDRDSIHEVCNLLSIDLFHNFLHGLSEGIEFTFVTASATSLDKPFYDIMLRIPDYIAGTLADYNLAENQITKEKFNTILTGYMAENVHNNFIFKLQSSDNILNCSRINIHSKN